MIPAVIYARYSTDKQDARSIDDQLRRCREFAERSGYDVVGEYHDEAISGTHMERAQLRKMIQAATATQRSPFRAVIVDDLSRLSRDIGDTHAIVFGELAGAGVKVLDTHGLDSEADSGEMTVAMRSIINREYIRGVAKQTHRGLEGRALAGFSTGGSQYGYKTINEPNPPIPERPRKLWVKHDEEAKIILRMFAEYDEGASGYKSIAEGLNDDGVPAPRDHRRATGNKHGGGWSAGTVRAILTNRRYIGEWAWNTSKWTRTNGKVKRRSRPKADHVVKVIPELAIVPRDLFDRVQGRLARVNRIGTHGGRPAGAGQRPYLVSGLLKCSSCGGPMSVHGQKTKNGVRYANFACTANRSRGASICANSSSISEKKITGDLVAAIRELLTDSDVIDAIVRGFERRASERSKKAAPDDTAKQLREAETRVKNVTAALARMPESEALYAQLATEEATVKRLSAQLAKARPDGPKAIPSKARIREAISRFLGSLADAPPAAREALAKVMPDGLTVRRNAETPGAYEATGALRVCELFRSSSGTGVSAFFRSGGTRSQPAETSSREYKLKLLFRIVRAA